MFDYKEAAQELYEQIDDDADVDLEQLEEDFEDYANMKVDRPEAMQSIRSKHENVVDMEDAGKQSAVEVTLDEIDEDEQSVTVEVQVVNVFDDTHEAIRQKGRIGDPTDVIGFVEFNGGDAPILEEGESYRLKNVLTDEYNGNFSVKMLQSAEVEKLDHDVEVTDNTATITAPIVNIQRGSGLIERCPVDDCTFVVTDRPCPEHGEVDGEDDLRIKAHVDNGHEVRTVIMDAEIVEELTGLTVEEGREIARDHMDRSVVVDEIREEIVGRYFQFTGLDFDDLIVQEFRPVDADPATRVESLLERAEEIEL